MVKSLSNWYYVNDEGLILTGDQVINGRQYYFNEDGNYAHRMDASRKSMEIL